jgi:predicted nucleic acid-binding protein
MLHDLPTSRGQISSCAPQDSAVLVKKYAVTPLDFADATLVNLAHELETERVLTLDKGGRTCRHGRNCAFP